MRLGLEWYALASMFLAFGFSAASASAADVEAGAKVFRQCQQCHRIGVGATNFYGPVLNGLIGRHAGTFPHYKYSKALEDSKIVWSYDTLSKYLKEPQHAVPGVAMTFKGLKSQTDIDNVIAYIAQFQSGGGKK